MRLATLLLMLLATTTTLAAGDLQPFQKESLAQIETAHRGRPFLLVLWSINCDYCREELRMLNTLQQTHPRLEYVLVAADTPQDAAAVTTMLSRLTPTAQERWLFADEFGARLRYAVDRHWQGELPRNYLYRADGTRTPHAGRLDAPMLLHWFKEAGDAR